VAPYRADVEQDGFVLGLGERKRSLTPRMPVNGLVARRAQIRRCGVFKLIAGGGESGFVHGVRIQVALTARPALEPASSGIKRLMHQSIH
jgi:hypothetical protein